MLSVSSSIPGRLRLRGVALRNPALNARLQVHAARWRHVDSVTVNPRVGSLLIRYDANRLDPERMVERLRAAAARLMALPVDEDQVPPAKPRSRGTARARANRLAKRVMVASLAASLVLGVTRYKRWHILTGWTFVGALAVHLWVYRRHIFR